MKENDNKNWMQNLDWTITLVPFLGIVLLAVVFMAMPEQSANILNILRDFLGNQMGFYYLLIGLGMFICSLYIAFSKYGEIQLGKINKPRYSDFTWGTMIFTSTMAADILYWSLIEWAYYANEPYIEIGSCKIRI